MFITSLNYWEREGRDSLLELFSMSINSLTCNGPMKLERVPQKDCQSLKAALINIFIYEQWIKSLHVMWQRSLVVMNPQRIITDSTVRVSILLSIWSIFQLVVLVLRLAIELFWFSPTALINKQQQQQNVLLHTTCLASNSRQKFD